MCVCVCVCVSGSFKTTSEPAWAVGGGITRKVGDFHPTTTCILDECLAIGRSNTPSVLGEDQLQLTQGQQEPHAVDGVGDSVLKCSSPWSFQRCFLTYIGVNGKMRPKWQRGGIKEVMLSLSRNPN